MTEVQKGNTETDKLVNRHILKKLWSLFEISYEDSSKMEETLVNLSKGKLEEDIQEKLEDQGIVFHEVEIKKGNLKGKNKSWVITDGSKRVFIAKKRDLKLQFLLRCDYKANIQNIENLEDHCPSCAAKILFANRYKIGDMKGRGGFAHTFEAWDVKIKEKFIIKFLVRGFNFQSKKYENEASETLKRFKREAGIGEKVVFSKHLVGSTTHGEDKKTGLRFIVQNYAKGKTLHDFMFSDLKTPNKKVLRELSFEEKLIIANSLANAVTELRGYNLVHRDLSPKNIIIDKEGEYRIQIIDFGISQFITDEAKKEESKEREEFLELEINESLTGHLGNFEEAKVLRYLTYETCAPEIISNLLIKNGIFCKSLKIDESGMPVSYACDLFSIGVYLYCLFFENFPHKIPERPSTTEKQRKFLIQCYKEKCKVEFPSLEANTLREFRDIFEININSLSKEIRDHVKELRENCADLLFEIKEEIEKLLEVDPYVREHLNISNLTMIFESFLSRFKDLHSANEVLKLSWNSEEGRTTIQDLMLFLFTERALPFTRELYIKLLNEKFQNESEIETLQRESDTGSWGPFPPKANGLARIEQYTRNIEKKINTDFQFLKRNITKGLIPLVRRIEVPKNDKVVESLSEKIQGLETKVKRALWLAIAIIISFTGFLFLYFQTSFWATSTGVESQLDSISKKSNRYSQKVDSLENSLSQKANINQLKKIQGKHKKFDQKFALLQKKLQQIPKKNQIEKLLAFLKSPEIKEKIFSLSESVSRLEEKSKQLGGKIRTMSQDEKKEQEHLKQELTSIQNKLRSVQQMVENISELEKKLAELKDSSKKSDARLKNSLEKQMEKTKKKLVKGLNSVGEITKSVTELKKRLDKTEKEIKNIRSSITKPNQRPTSGGKRTVFASFKKANLVLNSQNMEYTIKKTSDQYGVLVWLKWEKGRVGIEVQFSAQGGQAKSLQKEENLSWPKWSLGEKNLFFLITSNQSFSTKKVQDFCQKLIKEKNLASLKSGKQIQTTFQKFLLENWKIRSAIYWTKVDVVIKKKDVLKKVP